jgi:nitroreductase
MKTIDTETLLDSHKWRYATKQFDPTKKIDEATWQALEDVLVLSPSSFGLQPWKFIVVKSPEVREQLVKLAWGQKQIVEASHLVIFAVKYPLTPQDVRRYMERMAELHAKPVETLSGYENVVNGFIEKPPFELDIRAWLTRQCFIAMGNFMTSAALLGVDTCPMEGLDPAAFDKVLGLEGTGYYTVAACPTGYRHNEDKYSKLPKVRFEKKDVISHI